VRVATCKPGITLAVCIVAVRLLAQDAHEPGIQSPGCSQEIHTRHGRGGAAETTADGQSVPATGRQLRFHPGVVRLFVVGVVLDLVFINQSNVLVTTGFAVHGRGCWFSANLADWYFLLFYLTFWFHDLFNLRPRADLNSRPRRAYAGRLGRILSVKPSLTNARPSTWKSP
jgi:hypothetical protein